MQPIKILVLITAIIFLASLSYAKVAIPTEIQNEIDNAKSLCTGTFTFMDQHLQIIDLNEDGKNDYILSSQAYQCTTLASLYSGSAGFAHLIFLSDSSEKLTAIKMPTHAYDYKLDTTTTPPSVIYSGRCFMDGSKKVKSTWQVSKNKMTHIHSNIDCEED